MVADGLINGESGDGLRIGQVFLVPVAVGLPVKVPGHVSQGEAVHGAAQSLGIGVDVGHEILELGAVARAVRQVDISQHEHGVVLLAGNLPELEIHPFGHVGRLAQLAVNHRQDAASEGLVARRHAHEHIFMVFGRCQLVHAVLVRLYHLHPVGNDHIRNALFPANHLAIDAAARSRLEAFFLLGLHHHLHLAHLPGGLAAADAYGIAAVAEALVPEGGDIHVKERGRDILDGAGIQAAQYNLVSCRRHLRELDTERNGCGAIFDFHLVRYRELDIFQGSGAAAPVRGIVFFLAAGTQEQAGCKNSRNPGRHAEWDKFHSRSFILASKITYFLRKTK